VRMRPPIPHPMMAEGYNGELGVVRPALSALGGEGGEEKAEREVGRGRRVRMESAQSELGKQCRQMVSASVSGGLSLSHVLVQAGDQPLPGSHRPNRLEACREAL